MESLTIKIDRLRLYARHGVMEQERVVGNEFEVSVELRCANPKAGADDCIASTINYADVITTVEREMAVTSQLLEHAAWRIRRALSHDFPQTVGGSVTVTKLTPPCGVEVAGVGVTLTW